MRSSFVALKFFFYDKGICNQKLLSIATTFWALVKLGVRSVRSAYVWCNWLLSK